MLNFTAYKVQIRYDLAESTNRLYSKYLGYSIHSIWTFASIGNVHTPNRCKISSTNHTKPRSYTFHETTIEYYRYQMLCMAQTLNSAQLQAETWNMVMTALPFPPPNPKRCSKVWINEFNILNKTITCIWMPFSGSTHPSLVFSRVYLVVGALAQNKKPQYFNCLDWNNVYCWLSVQYDWKRLVYTISYIWREH